MVFLPLCMSRDMVEVVTFAFCNNTARQHRDVCLFIFKVVPRLSIEFSEFGWANNAVVTSDHQKQVRITQDELSK